MRHTPFYLTTNGHYYESDDVYELMDMVDELWDSGKNQVEIYQIDHEWDGQSIPAYARVFLRWSDESYDKRLELVQQGIRGRHLSLSYHNDYVKKAKGKKIQTAWMDLKRHIKELKEYRYLKATLGAQ